MSTYEKFTKDVGVLGLAQIALATRGLILLPIISKLLGPSGFGIWAQVLVTLGITEPLFELGLTNALIRFLAAEKDRREIQEAFYSVLCVMVACSLAIALILAFLAEPISNALFDGQGTTVVRLAAVVVPFAALYTVCLSYFRTFRQMRTYTAFIVLRSFGEIALVAGLVLSGFGVNGAVLSLAIAAFVTSVAALALIASRIGVKRPHFRHLKSYLKFGLPIVPMLLFSWITQSSDRYVIGYFLGIGWVGIYSAGYTLGSIIGWLHRPLMQALRPTVSKSFDEGKIAEVQTYLKYSLKFGLMLAIPSAVGLSLLGKPILSILTTAELASEGYLVIPFVALSMLIVQIYAVIGLQVLMLAKRTNTLLIIWGIAGLANLGLNLVFVPRYGILAAAGTTLLAYALAAAITIYVATRELTFPVDWISILKSLAASGVMSAVIVLINPIERWEVILSIGLGAIVYAVALLLFKGLAKDEIAFLSELAKKGLPLINRRG